MRRRYGEERACCCDRREEVAEVEGQKAVQYGRREHRGPAARRAGSQHAARHPPIARASAQRPPPTRRASAGRPTPRLCHVHSVKRTAQCAARSACVACWRSENAA